MSADPILMAGPPASIRLDGTWMFHVHGQVRGDLASLAIRLRLAELPSAPAGLLAGDLDRPGVPSLRVLPDGRVELAIMDQVVGLRTPTSLAVGRWAAVVVRYDRVRHMASIGIDGAGQLAAGFHAEVGIDLDTITIGGTRLLPGMHAVLGDLAEVRVAARWWDDQACADPFVQPVDAATAGWWRLDRLAPGLRPSCWRIPSLLGDSGEAASSIRLDAVDGGGGSIGSIGAQLIPSMHVRPEPVMAVDQACLARLGMTDARRSAVSTVPAWSWEAGLPTGNGEHGAMLLGRPVDEVLVVNRAGLYLPLHPPIAPPDQASILPQIRNDLAAGRFQQAADRVVELSRSEGYTEEKRWTDPFIPAAFLRIDQPASGPIRGYARGIDFHDGTVATAWSDQRGGFSRRLIASRADDAVVLLLQAPPASLDLAVSLVNHDPVAALDGPVPSAPVGDAMCVAEPGWLTCRQEYRHAWPGSIRAAITVARVVVAGGRQSCPDGLAVAGADAVLILLRTAIVRDGETAAAVEQTLRAGLQALPAEPELLWSRHREVHTPLFTRCRLDLGASEQEHLATTAALHAGSAVGATSRALIEKTFDVCRHLALCSSGNRFPPNLQGIWGGSWRASWSGDYTQNGNLQTAVSGHLAGGLSEAMEGFFSYQESLLPQYRQNARRLFGTRGILVPSRTSTHGLLNHFDGTWPMTFWTAGAAWNARFFFDHWLHSGDRGFLERRALPFMREAVMFYEDFLAGDGTASFRPSYSPENDSPATGSQSTVDAAMDVGACRQLLEDLLSLADTGLVTADELRRWILLRDRLPRFRIAPDGALAEWGDPRLTDRHEHRHASQLYAFYEGLPAWAEADAALMSAARTTVERRMVHRRAAGGGIMAFGMVQLGCAAASLRMAKDAGDIIDWLVNRFFFPESLVSAHNPRHVFNVDIAGGLPRLILLSLADSRPGRIDLLPALPPQWRTGEIHGLHCRGGVVIHRLAWTEASVDVTLVSPIDQRIEVRLPNGEEGGAAMQILHLRADVPVTLCWVQGCGSWMQATPAGAAHS